MKHRQRERKLDLSLRARVPSSRHRILRSTLAGFIALSTLSVLNASFAVDAIERQNSGGVAQLLSTPVDDTAGEEAHESPQREDMREETVDGEPSGETSSPESSDNSGHVTSPMAENPSAGDEPVADAHAPSQDEDQSRRASDEVTAETNPPHPTPQATPAPSPAPSGYSGFFNARRPAGVSTLPSDPNALPAVFATGGRGRFKNMIQWLQWADYNTHFKGNPRPNVPILRKGQSPVVIKNYRDYGDAGHLITECELSSLAHHSRKADVSPSQSDGPLVATIPGTWAGDVLDNLYNIGGPGQWSSGGEIRGTSERYPENYTNKNQMVIGLANGYAYNGNGSQPGQSSYQTGFSSEVSFDVHCNARLVAHNGTSTPVPLAGLVFADAEASSAYVTGADGLPEREEWVQAYAWEPGVKWRVLDTLRSDNCPTFTRGSYLDRDIRSTQLLRLMPSGSECAYQDNQDYRTPNGIGGPGAVTFMEGSNGATIRMQGSGYSAVALGLVIASDFGDAPSSYGIAGSLFQPSWVDGIPPNNNSHEAHTGADIVSMRKADARAGSSHLGRRIDADSQYTDSSRADHDDRTGDQTSDEDALDAHSLRTTGIRVSLGEKHQMVVPCRGPGKVAGWIDWDRNGKFHINTERSTIVECTGSQVTLEWKVPLIARRSVAGETEQSRNTFMRLRIADVQNNADMRPTGVTTAGEVEEYELRVYVPTITLKKHVDSYWGDEIKPARWMLTAQDEVGIGIGHYLWGYGETVEWPVTTKDFTLNERSDHVAISGYEAGQWSCREAANTINQPGYSYSTVLNRNVLHITGPDRIYCEITNRAKPASVSWEKTNKATGEHIGGSVWILRRGNAITDVIVEDCESATCTGLDKDNRPGYFKATPVKWGWYTVIEQTAPAGFIKDSREHTFPQMLGGVIDVALPAPIPNTPNSTTVIWRKVDASGQGRTLSGAQWRLERQGGATLAVSDCVASNQQACSGIDKDHRGGHFRITISDSGRYTLTETVAPIGYLRSTQPLVRNITAQEQGGQIDLGAIANTAITPPPLPFTGGTSADAFLIGGGGILGAAVLAAGYRRRQLKA